MARTTATSKICSKGISLELGWFRREQRFGCMGQIGSDSRLLNAFYKIIIGVLAGRASFFLVSKRNKTEHFLRAH
ncbi:hypothetical protein ACFOG5_10590 [Pedobacter fastidiosus]|uniref:hypothetical protein n=1 Tax=Pedobacter fastidiosus TaxID=2765361 RepID=UPI00361C817A